MGFVNSVTRKIHLKTLLVTIQFINLEQLKIPPITKLNIQYSIMHTTSCSFKGGPESDLHWGKNSSAETGIG